jgi:hypothetical protein
MAYEQKPGDIAIFRNERKDKETQPDWKGTLITPTGETLEVAVWEKGGKGTMLAGNVQIPRQRSDNAASDFRGGSSSGVAGSREAGRSASADMDDDIPFATRDSIL